MRIDLEAMTQREYDSYRAMCDSRSAAEFRYRREACGIELAELSADLGVRLDTVKRWENPKKGMPPSVRAWAYVDSAYLDMMDSVEAGIREVEEMADQLGEPRTVRLAYRRGIHPTRDGETVGRANAAARAAGIALTTLGYDVEFEWADEGTAGLAAMAPRQ